MIIPPAIVRLQAPPAMEAYRARAKELIRAEDFAGLEALANDTIVAFTDEPEPQADLGLALYHQNRFGEAVSAYREATSRDGSHAQWWAGLGLSIAKAAWNHQAFPVQARGADAEIAECGRKVEAMNDGLAVSFYRNPEVRQAAVRADDPEGAWVVEDALDRRGRLPPEPAGALRGDVVLDAAFGPDGEAAKVFALAGPAGLRPAAEAWARQWHFRPWRPHGKARPFHLVLVAHFSGK